MAGRCLSRSSLKQLAEAQRSSRTTEAPREGRQEPEVLRQAWAEAQALPAPRARLGQPGAQPACPARQARADSAGTGGSGGTSAAGGVAGTGSAAGGAALSNSIAAHLYDTCATVGGVAKCWGSNGSGRGRGSSLGVGQSYSQTPYSAVPLTLSSLGTNVAALSIGPDSYHACALANGGVMCWGDNGSGQLGDGTTVASDAPLQVVGLHRVPRPSPPGIPIRAPS